MVNKTNYSRQGETRGPVRKSTNPVYARLVTSVTLSPWNFTVNGAMSFRRKDRSLADHCFPSPDRRMPAQTERKRLTLESRLTKDDLDLVAGTARNRTTLVNRCGDVAKTRPGRFVADLRDRGRRRSGRLNSNRYAVLSSCRMKFSTQTCTASSSLSYVRLVRQETVRSKSRPQPAFWVSQQLSISGWHWLQEFHTAVPHGIMFEAFTASAREAKCTLGRAPVRTCLHVTTITASGALVISRACVCHRELSVASTAASGLLTCCLFPGKLQSKRIKYKKKKKKKKTEKKTTDGLQKKKKNTRTQDLQMEID